MACEVVFDDVAVKVSMRCQVILENVDISPPLHCVLVVRWIRPFCTSTSLAQAPHFTLASSYANSPAEVSEYS